MNMTALAANIARSVGQEFPAPAGEMALRQFMSLVEEGDELKQAIRDGTIRELRDEFADALITVYLLNHYLPQLDLDAELAAWTDGAKPESLYADQLPGYYIAQLAQPLRRALGHARRPGEWSAVGIAMVRVVLAIRSHAEQSGVNLTSAVTDKADVIFTRGWRTVAALNCDVCGKPIIGIGWRHHRLGVVIHGDDACQSNVRGEDVRGHCMTMIQCGAGAG
jgi:hypothetical protein